VTLLSDVMSLTMTNLHAGGLGFPLHDIGLSMAAVGVFLLPFSLVMFPVVRMHTICSL